MSEEGGAGSIEVQRPIGKTKWGPDEGQHLGAAAASGPRLG